ncbi:TniQ family protein [Micromonospora sp. NPDC126480]|uniref:TniQ family protein n=1 Tax=Micromonospora sp. NPDC126480 TaxID=3155312 RepID=UPI003316F8D5
MEGESFASWLTRTAAHLELPPGIVAKLLGLDRLKGPGFWPRLFGVILTPAARARASAASGLSHRELDEMHLSSYHGKVLDLGGIVPDGPPALHRLLPLPGGGGLRFIESAAPVRRGHYESFRRSDWWLPNGTRACPQCVEETGGAWKLSWRLGAVCACLTHNVLLLDLCPSCQQGLGWSDGGRPRLSCRQPAEPFLCGNILSSQRHNSGQRCRCQQRVDRLATVPMPDAVYKPLQTYLRAARGHSIAVGGMEVPARQWNQTFLLVAQMAWRALLSAPEKCGAKLPELCVKALAAMPKPSSAGTVQAASLLEGPPPNTALTAAVVAIAGEVLSLPNQDDVSDGIAQLAESAFKTPMNQVLRDLALLHRLPPNERAAYRKSVGSMYRRASDWRSQ